MAINIQTGTHKQLVDIWKTGSIVSGKSTEGYSWDGVKSIKLLSIVTEDLNDYKRSGQNRYGTPTDVQDTEDVLDVLEDKSFSKVIDKGDNSEQYMIKKAGKVARTIIDERLIPMQDKHCIKKWSEGAGQKVIVAEKLTKSTIIETIFKANELCIDKGVPFDNIYLYVPSDRYSALRLSPEFIGVDKLAEKSLSKGVVGEVADFKVVKVPKHYFVEGIEFLVAHKESVVAPKKINDTNIHDNPPGVNGHLIEGRFLYDAHVIAAKKDGVIVCGTQASLDALATPANAAPAKANAALAKANSAPVKANATPVKANATPANDI